MSDSTRPPEPGSAPPPPPQYQAPAPAYDAGQGQAPQYQGQPYEAQQPYQGQAQYQGQPQGTPTSGMAIAALIIGIVCLLLSFIPVINFLAIVGALVALILGIVAMRKVKSGAAGGRGLALGGIIVSALALIIAIAVNVAAAMAVQSFDNAVNDAIVEMEESANN